MGTNVNPSGNLFNITGGSRPLTAAGAPGSSLFHSFESFRVGAGDIANFLNDSGLATSNIFGRVTGGQPSLIFGTLRTTDFSSANLYLMNPAGVIFGSTAVIDLGAITGQTARQGGSFFATTADYIRLADGTQFRATAGPHDAGFSTEPAVAFGFLTADPAAISIQGTTIEVAEGQTIGFIGGNRGFTTTEGDTAPSGVTVTGGALTAPGGQIHVASVASPGEVLVPSLETVPNVDGNPFTAMGAITLLEGARLDVSGEAAGTVRIRGGDLTIANATISADTVGSSGAATAVDIRLTGDLTILTDLNPAITAKTTGAGGAGEIHISATNMRVDFPSTEQLRTVIDTHTSDTGKGGNVVIAATDAVSMIAENFGLPFFIDTGTTGPLGGQGGHLTISANKLDLQNGYLLSGDLAGVFRGEETFGSGGHVTISANTVGLSNAYIFTDGFAHGSGGNLTISSGTATIAEFSGLSVSGFERVGRLRFTADQLRFDSSQVESSLVQGDGGAPPTGGITIEGRIIEFANGSTIASQTFGPGAAADITVTATEGLRLVDDPSSFGTLIRPSGLFTNAFEGGASGAILVTTPNLQVSGGARIDSSTNGSGSGGSITIVADALSLVGERATDPLEGQFGLGSGRPSGIYARTVGDTVHCGGPCGNAGLISVTTHALSFSDGAQINSGTINDGQGGNIAIMSSGTIAVAGTMLDGTPGGIFSRTVGTDVGAGRGGIIELAAIQTTISNGALLSASSSGPGAAGSVTVQGLASPAQSVLIDGAGSGIFTDTQGTGAGGNIRVETNTLTIQSGGTLSAATAGTEATAAGGAITVEGSRIQLNGGALITASTTGPGNAGSVTINATDSVTLAGQVKDGSPPPLSARARITTNTTDVGNGGDVTITAGKSVSLSGNLTGVFTDTAGIGHAGNVAITAPAITLDKRAHIVGTAQVGSEGRGGDITLQGDHVALTGLSIVRNDTFGTGDAGNVRISATQSFSLTDAFVASTSNDADAGRGGNISISAPLAELRSGNLNSQTLSAGSAGDILLELNTLRLDLSERGRLPESGAEILADTGGIGNGGAITIRGLTGPGSRAEDVTVSNFSSILSQTGGEGAAGKIQIDTQRLTISTGSRVATTSIAALGPAGDMAIDASESVRIANLSLLESSSIVFSEGQAGTITVKTPSLTVEQRAAITTSTEFTGNAGSILVKANAVTLREGGQLTSSSLAVDPDFPPTGHAGSVTVKGLASPAQSVLIDGAGSGIFTDTQGTGAGGNIRVETNTLTMQNGGTLSAATAGTTDTATGGNVELSIPQALTMTNGALITTTSSGPANAGSIVMEDPRPATITMTDSAIIADATAAGSAASGGNITLLATNTIRLLNSRINSSVVGNESTVGGTIFIDPQLVFLQNSQILATAVQGQGGNITIIAGTFLADPSSSVSASSQLGINGTVDIRATVQNLSGALVPLQQDFLAGGSLVAQRCAARAMDGQVSSFILAGREGLPAEPDGVLASPLEPRVPLGASPLVLPPLPPAAPAILLAAGPGFGLRPGDRAIQTEDFTGACRR